MPEARRKGSKDYQPSGFSGDILPACAWPEMIPDDQWAVYRRVIRTARARGIPFAAGGAFGLATYTSRWRNSKDLDLYVTPDDLDRMVQVLQDCGLTDYYEQLPYDRAWIWRGYSGAGIVDIIFAMANQRAQVDEGWLTRGPMINVRGEPLRILPPEELIWAKLYVVQRDRCDWPDVLNVLYATGKTLDWDHLLARVGDDACLLGAVVTAFAWLCPDRARALPRGLWSRLRAEPTATRDRVRLLDSRPWFHADETLQPCV